MPYNSTPPNWRSRKHPLNDLLRTLGSGGGTPTASELNTLPGGPTVRAEVRAAATRINKFRDAGEFQAAREAADEALGRLGKRYGHLPLPEPEPEPEPTNLDTLAARMFTTN
jgi:hypothetical protein